MSEKRFVYPGTPPSEDRVAQLEELLAAEKRENERLKEALTKYIQLAHDRQDLTEGESKPEEHESRADWAVTDWIAHTYALEALLVEHEREHKRYKLALQLHHDHDEEWGKYCEVCDRAFSEPALGRAEEAP